MNLEFGVGEPGPSSLRLMIITGNKFSKLNQSAALRALKLTRMKFSRFVRYIGSHHVRSMDIGLRWHLATKHSTTLIKIPLAESNYCLRYVKGFLIVSKLKRVLR